MNQPIIWSLKELAEITKRRIENKFDSNIAVTGLTGIGKCQTKGSKVLMANGEWKNIENIKLGDLVLSPQKDGSHTFARVNRTYKWRCDNIYDVFQKNRKKKKLYSCSNNHDIPYLYRQLPRIKGIRDNKNYKWIYKKATAEEFSKFSKNTLGHGKIGFSSFMIQKFKNRENCKIEPYVLGVWLGDGHFSKRKGKNGYYQRALGITSNDFKILEEISKFYPIISLAKKENTTAKTYRFSLNGKFAEQLSEFGLEGKGSGSKFIPKECLLSNSAYRLRLLAGLIDSDGSYWDGSYHFTLKSKRLIEDIKALVYSLGGRTGEIRKIKKKSQSRKEGTYFSLCLYLKDLELPLKVKHKIKTENSFYLDSNRVAIEVKKTDKREMVYGFSINSPSKWYITDNWMITHNSTLLWKFFHKFPDFNVKDKFTMRRRNMIELVQNKRFSYCWNDELISSASKRTFFDQEQNELIQVLTKYRNNFNIVGGAVPFFFTLDKELIKLFGMHINIIRRGIGVVHLPRDGRMYTEDMWDIKVNSKLEERWSAKVLKNPDFKIPYHKYTTFAGYVYFGAMSKKQEETYDKLKSLERGDDERLNQEANKPQETFHEKIFRLLKERKLDESGLLQLCLYEEKKLSNVKVNLNRMLRDEGSEFTLKDLLKSNKKSGDTDYLHNNNTIKELSSIEV